MLQFELKVSLSLLGKERQWFKDNYDWFKDSVYHLDMLISYLPFRFIINGLNLVVTSLQNDDEFNLNDSPLGFIVRFYDCVTNDLRNKFECRTLILEELQFEMKRNGNVVTIFSEYRNCSVEINYEDLLFGLKNALIKVRDVVISYSPELEKSMYWEKAFEDIKDIPVKPILEYKDVEIIV